MGEMELIVMKDSLRVFACTKCDEQGRTNAYFKNRLEELNCQSCGNPMVFTHKERVKDD